MTQITRMALQTIAEQYANEFSQGELSVFIIVRQSNTTGRPFIWLISRLRFGSDVLPIPAWLSRKKAEQAIANHPVLAGSMVIEVRHSDLQEMITDGRYDPLYPKVTSYHLDLQLSEDES